MKTTLNIAAAALLVAGLTGCGSTPVTSYYTLMAPASMPAPGSPRVSPPGPVSEPPAPGAAASPYLIDLQPVGVPEALDQPQLVVRRSGSAVVVLEHERWSAPLSEELRAALSAQLARQLGTQDVAGLTAAPGREVLRIRLQLRRFDAWPGDHVDLEADWSLQQASDPKLRLNCRTALAEISPGAYADMVGAQQRLLARLGAAMAAAIRQWPAAACPAER